MEGGENFIAPQNVKEGLKPEGEIIESRFNQTDASKLAEYITGLKPDDPKMVDQLIKDQEIFRVKYGLPNTDIMYKNPDVYYINLMEFADKKEIKVKSTSEYGLFFKENFVTAASFPDGSIGIDIDKTTEENFIKSLTCLRHELIHQVQDKKMSIEQMEYEAYVDEFPVLGFKKYPEYIEINLFDFYIKNSVLGVYNKHDEENGNSIKPVWSNPEYFLKNVDGISEEKIQEYKEKQSLDNVRV